MTVWAPRSRTMCATSLSVREANESSTSSAVTSMITPRMRNATTLSTSASRSANKSESDNADWMLAIKNSPCLRIGTITVRPQPLTLIGLFRRRIRRSLFDRDDLGDAVAEQALGLFDAALQVADRVHLAEIDADVDEGLRDRGRKTGHDHGGAEEPRCLDRLHEVVRDARVHG